jgi:hypothetical protein
MEKQKEIALIDKTLKLLQRGKYELTGEEAIIFHACFSYLVGRLNQLKAPEQVPVQAPIKTSKGKK